MMNMQQACGVVARQRGEDSLLVATMGAMYAFDRSEAEDGRTAKAPTVSRLSSVPLMGGAAGLGLGLALARPDRKVVVVDGDASLLMELSGLVTVAQAAPANLLHVVIRNGTQFTGLANLHAPAQGFSFADAARNAGYRNVETIEDGERWAERFTQLLNIPGPNFVELLVEPMPQRTQDGFEQTEMPDLQFERMGQEALAVQQYLKSGVA